jgi:hypothetical protein
MVSVHELLERGGKGYHMWFVTEYEDLERGKTPVTSGVTIEKAFALHKKHPLTYDPEIIFSTPQVGVKGEEMLYSANWLIDLAQAKDGRYFIGKRDFSGESDMWSGLVGLQKNYNEIVSLHELGRSSIHTVLQSYHLKGLEPGMVYRFEIGVSYASQPDLGTQMQVRDLTLDKMLDLSGLFEYGYAKHPQLSVIFFEAEADEHIVDLQVRDRRGYVLLNYIELEKTSMTALPRNVSYGAKVVDKTRFYDGYGPENALDGDPFNNFVAARESTLPNSFTIDTGKPVIPVALNLIWNSAKEYGVDFTFKAGSGGEVTLLDVRSNRPQNSRSNRFFLPSDRVYRYYQFVVNRAAGQERLLLLDFDLIGAPPPESGQLTKVQSENEDMLFPHALQ